MRWAIGLLPAHAGKDTHECTWTYGNNEKSCVRVLELRTEVRAAWCLQGRPCTVSAGGRLSQLAAVRDRCCSGAGDGEGQARGCGEAGLR